MTTLIEFGRTLVAAGFEVWHTSYGRDGYLTYRNPENDCWGTLQHSDHEGWQHLMPISPSVEAGSSMFIDKAHPPFTVEAARQCARPTNYNSLVRRRENHAPYLSPRAVQL